MPAILVVDDNDASRELLCEVLAAPGREIEEAADGEQALRMIAARAPDIVLLDLEMPRLGGEAVLKEIRRDPRYTAIPVVAVTANAMRGDRERVLAAGFDEYVSKPIEAAGLRRRVADILARKGTS